MLKISPLPLLGWRAKCTVRVMRRWLTMAVVGVGLLVALALAPAPVGAQGACNNPGHAGVADCPPGTSAPPATPPGRVKAPGSDLPVTGGDVLGLATIGLLAVGGGAALVTLGRRRRAATPA